jgi:hypothetical protein
MSLDRAHEILSWRVSELDSQRLNVLEQVLRIILMIGVRALLDGRLGREAARNRDRERILRRARAARRPQALVTPRPVRAKSGRAPGGG